MRILLIAFSPALCLAAPPLSRYSLLYHLIGRSWANAPTHMPVIGKILRFIPRVAGNCFPLEFILSRRNEKYSHVPNMRSLNSSPFAAFCRYRFLFRVRGAFFLMSPASVISLELIAKFMARNLHLYILKAGPVSQGEYARTISRAHCFFCVSP